MRALPCVCGTLHDLVTWQDRNPDSAPMWNILYNLLCLRAQFLWLLRPELLIWHEFNNIGNREVPKRNVLDSARRKGSGIRSRAQAEMVYLHCAFIAIRANDAVYKKYFGPELKLTPVALWCSGSTNQPQTPFKSPLKDPPCVGGCSVLELS